jgi:hypothetical protein
VHLGKSAKKNEYLSTVSSTKICTGKEKKPDCVPDAGRMHRKQAKQNARAVCARMLLFTRNPQGPDVCKAGMTG